MAESEPERTTIQVTKEQSAEIDAVQPEGKTKGEFVYECVQAYADGETIEETRVVNLEDVKAELINVVQQGFERGAFN